MGQLTTFHQVDTRRAAAGRKVKKVLAAEDVAVAPAESRALVALDGKFRVAYRLDSGADCSIIPESIMSSLVWRAIVFQRNLDRVAYFDTILDYGDEEFGPLDGVNCRHLNSGSAIEAPMRRGGGAAAAAGPKHLAGYLCEVFWQALYR